MRDRPCHSTLHLPSRPLPPRPQVSFLHRAPCPSHPLTCKSPIKSHHPEPCSSKQGLPLEFSTPAVETTVSQKVSRHLVSVWTRRCVSFRFGPLLCCVQPQSLPGSGGGELSRFCFVDVALNFGTCARHHATIDWCAPQTARSSVEGVRQVHFHPITTVRHINPKDGT